MTQEILERRSGSLKPQIVLIRGLPGSGKTTMAKEKFPYHVLCEADQYFIDNEGNYNFDPKQLSTAHENCYQRARRALSTGFDVVIANTFTRKWEMERYFDLAKECETKITVYEADGEWENIHNVPDEAIERMKERWETLQD